jgi:hypothetical protein
MRYFVQVGTLPRTPFCRALVLAAMVAGALTLIVPQVTQAAKQDQQPPSLGAIARQLRAQKPVAPASAKVWTNENLPQNPFAISIVGPPPPPPEAKPSADDTKDDAKAGEKPAAGGKAKTLPEMEAEVAQAQKDLELQAKQLDLAKRDYTLQQQAFYANAMASQDAAGQAQLAEAQKQIDTMQQALDAATAHLAELQSKVDELKKGAPATAPVANPSGSGPGN